MDKSCNSSKKVASSTKVTKYVLCKMPADWTTLPVHSDIQATPRRESIAVYAKRPRNQNLVYEGFICPPSLEKLYMSGFMLPPKEESFAKKYEILQEKIRAEEAEAEALKKVISEDKRSTMAQSAASSKPGQGVVRAQPSTTPGCEDTAKKIPVHLNTFLQWTESNNDYPLPEEILNGREGLSPGGAECYFEPMVDTVDTDFLNSFNAYLNPPEQLGSEKPLLKFEACQCEECESLHIL
ncbi:uncharacterized protein LOC131987061 [Centropristis striata]|uniref:uncharacterized protein LOC131987061 n=1 Tax=Centropristis striata TaxID=184440 RepID=UPI0027DEFE39|nr:uncharacterized protein LOC131987061 [Centropristis striata]